MQIVCKEIFKIQCAMAVTVAEAHMPVKQRACSISNINPSPVDIIYIINKYWLGLKSSLESQLASS